MSRPQSDVKFHIYSRPNSNIWWLWGWRDRPDGSRCRCSVSTARFITGPLTRAEYTQDQAQILVNKATGVAPDSVSAVKRLSVAWAEEYIRDRIEHEGKSKKTLNWYLNSLAKFKAFYGDSFSLGRYRAQDIWDFQRYALDSKCQPVTVNTYCRGLQGVYSRLVRQGILERNPFDDFERIREVKKKNFLTLAELKQLLESLFAPALVPAPGEKVIKPRPSLYISRRLVRMLICTGLRRVEILCLERSDVDFPNMRFRPTNIKSADKHKRWIAIPPKIAPDFAFFLNNFDASYDDKPGLPFYRCHPDTLTHWCKEHLIDAKLPDYHTHNLRHTFATLALENGMTLRDLQKYLDHSDTSVTELYAHDIASIQAPELGI